MGLLSGGESDTISRTADLSFKNRFIGLKSRGCYDSPAMTILRLAHLDAESLVMDGKVRSLRDQFVTYHWSELLYNGLYFSPEREFVENSLVFSQRRVVCGYGPNPCQKQRLQSCPLLQSRLLTPGSRLERGSATPLLQGLRVCSQQEFGDREALLLGGGLHGLAG